MRVAVIATLQALYDGKEVTAIRSIECSTTRITNEISILRNELNIAISTDRIDTSNHKWYGSYRLIRTDENLKSVRAILRIDSNQNEAKNCKN